MASNNIWWGWADYAKLHFTVNHASRDIPNNRSRFTWSVVLDGYKSRGNTGNLNVTISDQWSSSRDTGYKADFWYSDGGQYTIASGSFYIYHNPDGSMPNINFKATVTSTLLSTGVIPVTLTGIPSIPRQSGITNASNFYIRNGNVKFTIDSHSSAFTHKYEILQGSYQLANGRDVKGGSFDINLSAASRNRLLAVTPNSTSVTVTIAVSTWNGGTQIGSTVKKNIVAYVDSDYVPTFGSIMSKDTNTDIANKIGSYVQGQSRIQIYTNNVVVSQGSTLKTIEIRLDNQTKSSTSVGQTFGAINKSGSISCSIKVIDSRGRTATKSSTINQIPYVPPKITGVSSPRTNSSGTADGYGTYTNTFVKYVVSALNGKAKTVTNIKIKQGNGSYVLKHQMIDTGTTNSYSRITAGIELKSSYSVQVEIIDVLGGTAISVIPIAVGAVTMDFGIDNVGVGKFWERGTLDVEGDIYQNNKRVVDFNSIPDIIPSGSDANDYWKHGIWRVENNAAAQNIRNLPVQIAGRLFVTTIRDYSNLPGDTPWMESQQEYRDLTGIAWRRRRIVRDDGKPTWTTWQMDGMPEYWVSGNQWYYKYPDGRLECFLRTNCQKITDKWAGHFYGYLDVKYWTFPAKFLAPPLMTASGSNGVARFDAETISAVDATGLSLYREIDTTKSSSIIVKAEGQWK